MPWSKSQRMTAGIAARSADWNPQQREMVLRGFGNRAMFNGKITSTSPRLNNDDFEIYMAIAEATCQGQLNGYALGHWHTRAEASIRRQLRKIAAMAEQLVAEGHLSRSQVNGVCARATAHKAETLPDLERSNDRQLAGKVIDALSAIGNRHKVRWREPQTTETP